MRVTSFSGYGSAHENRFTGDNTIPLFYHFTQGLLRYARNDLTCHILKGSKAHNQFNKDLD